MQMKWGNENENSVSIQNQLVAQRTLQEDMTLSQPHDAGVKPIDIQPLSGYSTLAMTEHYIGQHVAERGTSQMAKVPA